MVPFSNSIDRCQGPCGVAAIGAGRLVHFGKLDVFKLHKPEQLSNAICCVTSMRDPKYVSMGLLAIVTSIL